MAMVRFLWNPSLVDVRRETCPAARFEKAHRRWVMTEAEASEFLQAAHARLAYTKTHARIMVNEKTWVVGFVQGAPFCTTAAPKDSTPELQNLNPG